MTIIENKTMDAERALYGSDGVLVRGCAFDGPATARAPSRRAGTWRLKTASSTCATRSGTTTTSISGSELTDKCRAALWYSEGVEITDTKMHGIKALRECADVKMRGCDIVSPEFGWSVRGCEMANCTAESEYFMMRSTDLHFKGVKLKGKYSFQYIENSVFENCEFDTKDAFWHAKNVIVRDSVVKGEYLAWYCENVTFERCRIIGTQPLCYCKGLKLIDCEMINTDLAFEKSEVEATVTTVIDSIKNPYAGRISAPAAGEIIIDDPMARCELHIAAERVCA